MIMPQITAQLNYLRIAPRKVRTVVDIIKGLDVDLAQAQLKYITKRPARSLLKLLNSAAANAQNNFGLNKNHLYIKEIIVNEGMKLKRHKPKGFGMVMPIQRKTSHIKVVLGELSQEEKKKKDEILAKMPKPAEIKKEKVEEKKGKDIKEKKTKAEMKPRMEKERKAVRKGAFGGIKALGRRLFRRKSI